MLHVADMFVLQEHEGIVHMPVRSIWSYAQRAAAPSLCCLLCASLQPSKPDAAISLTQAFSLHSRPNATRKIMLDFDGSVTQNSAWNIRNGQTTIKTPPYDKACACVISEPSPVPCRRPLSGTHSHTAPALNSGALTAAPQRCRGTVSCSGLSAR